MRIKIGKLVNFHGVRGEVKILSNSDFLEDRFAAGNTVEIAGRTLTIDSYRTHKNFHMLKFEGVSNMNDILHLKGEDVFIEESDEDLDLDDNEYHVKDIVGLTVINLDDNTELGKISEVMFTGANDVWVIQGEREYLIPYIEQVVKTVDIERGIVEITPLEGLLD
ncbi:Ribosome maturation factor RimM [Jeotgalicoccus saudimassiliensis]|uniref:Ribosome maturation factor RimM n=1 Tax=Jeotgalicoccus saudimassiliensis TaxID=1461582 RepID=A0A078M4A0_9STAP|nr:ribosome maturation factor RimM [Jeotgalicoccus saudimassiliensis]CDZ99521.1 Ribosome maturation factor RimM [Jeotgalicoccus saudimassiliensis]